MFLFVVMFLTIVSGCDKKEDKPENVVHDNTVEYYVTTEKLPTGAYTLNTHLVVFNQNSQKFDFSRIDTLPNPGTQVIEDDDGNKQTVPNEYQVYFTIKNK